ncbi:MAG: 3-keto-5-aminohexanoate cleavage protein [Christensenellales bacterium]|jgi:3-keto-5-aminohexanoate cleavage enzyme
MTPVILSVAPVNAGASRIDKEALVRDILDCAKAGAAMVHLHVRDESARLTDDLSLTHELVCRVREHSDIIIQVSTGGVSNLSIAQRCAPCAAPWAESHSLNVGSLNLGRQVYQNPLDDVEYCVNQILSNKKVPEVEVFELGMIKATADLAERFVFPRPLLFAIVLGHQGGAPATEQTLDAMLSCLKEFFPSQGSYLWGLTQAHRAGFALMRRALELGADSLRVGFEDSASLSENQTSSTNAQIVRQAVDMVREAGRQPATPQQARTMLGIKGGAL